MVQYFLPTIPTAKGGLKLRQENPISPSAKICTSLINRNGKNVLTIRDPKNKPENGGGASFAKGTTRSSPISEPLRRTDLPAPAPPFRISALLRLSHILLHNCKSSNLVYVDPIWGRLEPAFLHIAKNHSADFVVTPSPTPGVSFLFLLFRPPHSAPFSSPPGLPFLPSLYRCQIVPVFGTGVPQVLFFFRSRISLFLSFFFEERRVEYGNFSFFLTS